MSYTELEYNYALSKNMPVFSVVLHDNFLLKKAASLGKEFVFEEKSPEKYKLFKQRVTSNIVKFISNVEQISSIIKSQINEIINNYPDICGWIRNTKKFFDTSEELDLYLANQILNAKKCVYDLTWKDYHNTLSMRPDYNAYIKGQHTFLKNAKEILEHDVFYREIFTFPHYRSERVIKMQELIQYDNYWCGFFESNSLTNIFPKLHITIIDDSEVIFSNYDYRGNLCSTSDKNIVKILEAYFDECWALCQKIKDYEGIHQNVLNKLISTFPKE